MEFLFSMSQADTGYSHYAYSTDGDGSSRHGWRSLGLSDTIATNRRESGHPTLSSAP